MTFLGLGAKPQGAHVSTVSNPFKKGNVVQVRIYVGSWTVGSAPVFTADIIVAQGKTTGKHEVEGFDYADLMTKLNAVLEGL